MAPNLGSCSLFLVSLLSFSLLFTISSSSPTYLSNYCSNDDAFTPNSQYQANLHTLVSSLSSKAISTTTGFFSSYAGSTATNDAVYGFFLCRGDQSATSCQQCVTTAAATDLRKWCPQGKSAIIWYNECMVRYSNQPLAGIMSISPVGSVWGPRKVIANRNRFVSIEEELMDKVTNKAAGDEPGKKFATGEEEWEGSEKLYGLGQCTPDLTPRDCNMCLRAAVGSFPVAADEIQINGSALYPSCFAQFAIATQPFFNSPPPNNSTGDTLGSADGLETGNFLQYRFDTLKYATNNFSDENKLGEGGFGGVYKGILTNGQEIAVKRLSKSSSQGIQEFKNEVLLVAKLKHRNLVRLLGFCVEGKEKLLVYEFVHNKSLNYFLFDMHKRHELNWETRYKIIQGIAQGMLYLHQDSQPKIIHRDLKASNILLDAEMNPKISDFGMARIFGIDEKQANTNRIVGTFGYMAPEYALRGQFSVKADVYSFGVLILEIISGKKNNNFPILEYGDDFLSYAWKQWKDETPMNFVDPVVRDSCLSNEVMRCMQLALLCVQYSVDKRPTMAAVVHKLDRSSDKLPVPEEPAFFMGNRAEMNSFQETGYDQSASMSMSQSMNIISVTEAEPR